MQQEYRTSSAPFWLVWGIEFWERFGFYGFQAIIALYFTNKLGMSEKETIYLMGSFFAFTFGFIWVGGLIGDKILGAKRTIIVGATILGASYLGFMFANKEIIYYIFAGIIIGNAIFKANPSSLISQMFNKGDSKLDSAMTLYYLAINIGGLICMAITPVISETWGYTQAFVFCGVGLLIGLFGFLFFYKKMDGLDTQAGDNVINKTYVVYAIAGTIAAFLIIANILPNTALCIELTAVVVTIATIYYLYIAFSLEKYERNRMLVALVLIIEAIIFYSLYFQMPTTLTFFAEHNVELRIFNWHVPAAQYQFLNPFWILLLSPLLAMFYKKTKFTHATKFCIGTVLMFVSYLTLYCTKYFAIDYMVSGNWLILSYASSSLAELLISALGLAMVAELCPRFISGFVMGFWFLAAMIASYVSAFIGSFIALPSSDTVISKQHSLETYTTVFGYIALGILVISLIMILIAPTLNKYINKTYIPKMQVLDKD